MILIGGLEREDDSDWWTGERMILIGGRRI